MKIRTAGLVAGFALSVLATAAAFAAVQSLSSEVTLQPAEKPGAYLATVEIRDAGTQEVLSAPRIAFMKGEGASTQTTLPSGEEVLFTIQVEASGTSATYTAELRSAGKSVVMQKATIALAR